MTRNARLILLFCTLAAALALRLPGIGWGLPPVNDHVRSSNLRSSYAFDEDDILSSAAKASVARFDFDPHDYHWGTLHFELVLLALDSAQAAGLFPAGPWRDAYYGLQNGFIRTYKIGRLVSIAMALLAVWVLFLIPGDWAGPFAAMLVAVSPTHVLQSDQVRVDATMLAMFALTLWAAIRGRIPLLGIFGGLAIAGKYSIAPAVAAILIAALWSHPWRAKLIAGSGLIIGFLAGSPYILVKPGEFYESVAKPIQGGMHVSDAFAVPIGELLAMRAANLVRFSIGLPAALLAIAGIVWMLRRRSRFDWIVLSAIALAVVTLIGLRWPLIRYDLPLIVLLGLCAGVALEHFSQRWRYALIAIALIMPLCGAIAQIHYMRSEQPANLMLARILEIVPPGTPVSRLMREAPPLDEKIYPRKPNVFLDDLAANPPEWALTSDLPDAPYRPATVALLASSYDQIAHFETPRILGWATFGEAPAPHDWKYTHIQFTLYHRKQR